MKLLSTHSQSPNEWAPWVKTGDRVFYLLSSYSEKDVPKSAGWAFAKETKKLWFTTDYDKACRLADYADGELHAELSAQKIALATNEEKSRKEHSDIELIHPEGLDYKPFQYAGIDFMISSDKPGILLGDDMGLGKEQPVSEPVLTRDGWKPIGEIKVGDYCIGSTGLPVKVTGVFPQGEKDVYSVNFSDGVSVRCGRSHLWNVKTKDAKNYKTKTLNDIVSSGLKNKDGTSKYSIPNFCGVVGRELPLVIEPYLLGIIIANGSCNESSIVVTINENDSDVISRIGGEWEQKQGCKRHILKGEKKWVRYFGLCLLSKNKFIPEIYKKSSYLQRLELLKGLMDCDGSNVKNRITYHTVSLFLANDVADIVRSLGGTAVVRDYERDGYVEYQVNVKMPVCPFFSKRKSKYWKKDKRILGNHIVSVEKIGKEESVCIMVDYPDHLYVTKGYKLTHNTIQIIGLYNNCEKIRNVLIVCPNTLKLNWLREFQKWDCKGGRHAIANTKICPLPEHGYNVVIINYEGVSKQNAKLASLKWDMIAVDEAHSLKNEKNVRNKAMFGSEKYKRIDRDLIVLATGTPLPNRVMEMWPLISECDPDRWNHNTKWKFISKYCGGNPKGYSADDKLNELQKILRQTIMVRRLKKDVLKELPPKMRQVVELEYDEDDKVMIEALNHEKTARVAGEKDVFEAKVRLELSKAEDNEEEYKAAIANITEVAKIAFQDMAKARYETAVAKIPYVIQYLENALETVNKIIVFAHHKEVLNTIAKHFGVSAVVIHGDISLQDRQSAVDRFQGDASVRVGVMSIKAAGVGITLTAASTEFFAELDWVPGNILQCEDRCIVKNSLVWCLRSDYINDMILKKIQDVNVGDMVLTHKGNVRKVIDKFTKNNRGMVTKIDYVGWYEPLECTYDHKILVKRDGEVQWIEAYKLLPSDSMCFPKNKNYKKLESVKIKDEWRLYSEEFFNSYKNKKCSHEGCSDDVVARGLCSYHYRSMLKSSQRPEKPTHVNTRYIRLPNEIVIDDEWLYIFGWFAAEGFSSIAPGKSKFLSFSAHEKEADVLIKIQKKFSSLNIKGTVYSNKKTKGIELRVYSGEIAYWFRDWFGHYAENKKLPIEIMELDPDQAAVFLRGYTDGDGYQRNKQVEWASASKELCYQMCILTIRSGFIPTMRVAEPEKEHYHHHWYGGYTKFSNCSNKRMQDQDDDYIYRPISKVETRNDKVDVYDLTVEEDHSFTVGFATVHNCVRIGQESDIVNIYQLVVRGSIDVNMAHKMIEKMHIAEQTLDKTSAAIPILPDDDEPVTSTISRIRIESELKEFNVSLIPVIMEGLQIVAGYDTDYARAKNDMGFNAIDTRIGHDLASKGYLTPKQAILAKNILKKYRKQIPFNIYYNIFESGTVEEF